MYQYLCPRLSRALKIHTYTHAKREKKEREREREREKDQNIVDNLLRYHHREK